MFDDAKATKRQASSKNKEGALFCIVLLFLK